MPYNGPVWQSMAGADKRGEIYLQAGLDFANKISDGIKERKERMAGLASKRDAVQATEGAWEVLSAQHPDLLAPFDEKFRTGSAGAKQGILSQAIAAIARNDTASPAPFTTDQGGRGYINRRTGAITPARDLEPPPLPQDVPNPNGGPKMGMNANGTVFEYAKPDPTSEWKEESDGTVRHYKNGQPTGAMFRKPEKPGYATDENGVGYYKGTDGKPVALDNLLVLPPPPGKKVESSAAPDLQPPEGDIRLPKPLIPRTGKSGSARSFRDMLIEVPVQQTDGTIVQRKTLQRSWDDGSVDYLQPPNDDNTVNGQTPEWKSIVPIRGQTPASATATAPAPTATTTAPAAAKPFWKR